MEITIKLPDGTTIKREAEEVTTPPISIASIEKAYEERRAERIKNVKAPKHYAAMDDRPLVIACLHYEGEIEHLISSDLQWDAYCEADGFGYLDADSLAEINDGWDWSHVRDSTDEGFARVADLLRRNLRTIFSLEETPDVSR